MQSILFLLTLCAPCHFERSRESAGDLNKLTMQNKNWYIILGVSKTANLKEIKSAYRRLAKQFHPDKNQGDKSAEERFKEVQQAYMVLSNPEKRRKFDQGSSGTGSYVKKKQYGRYNGNAYQYAQQQARQQQRTQEEDDEYDIANRYKTELNYILISFIVALILLYLIVSF